MLTQQKNSNDYGNNGVSAENRNINCKIVSV